ncbi:hypothetical protein QR680_003698 [Steinernema hermaphroditum]|uniref:Uncharacterized protein n=1 Tax=Steinernema hermaphroditum TaxID=289476 RepID=A0AA39HML6_9BILA|nr:hypothetical protein QR680_003698 [Steinernema hermaphroditum]
MVALLPVVIGTCYLFSASIMFALNGLLFLALLLKKDYKKSTFRVIMSLNVSCMLQLFVLACGGIMTIAQTNFDENLDKILGAIMQGSWLFYVGITLVLSVDRLLVFVRPRPAFFSNLTNILMALCWLFGIALFILFLCPGYGYTYKVRGNYYFWTYNNEDGSQTVSLIEPYFDLPVLASVFIIYLFVFAYIMKVRKSSNRQSSSLSQEKKVLLVAVVSCAYELNFVLSGFWLPVELIGPRAKCITFSFLWIIECGMFVIATFIISANLRRKTFDLLRNNTKVIMVSSVQKTKSRVTVTAI